MTFKSKDLTGQPLEDAKKQHSKSSGINSLSFYMRNWLLKFFMKELQLINEGKIKGGIHLFATTK